MTKTRRQWNSIPEEQRQPVVEVALEHPALSPVELAVKITDEQQVFISESSVYRILKAQGLVTTPAHILLSAAKELKDKTCFVHELWQSDFTYLKVLGRDGTTSPPFWMISAALSSIGLPEEAIITDAKRTGWAESLSPIPCLPMAAISAMIVW